MRQMIAACAAAALLWPVAANATTPEEKAQQIAGALHDSGELVNYRVGVRYQDGVALLLGTVTSDEQATTAARIAGEVDGVKKVISKITVGAATEKASPAPKAEPKQQANTAEQAEVLLAMMEQEPKELPPIPSAMPTPAAKAAPVAQPAPTPRVARRGMPRPLRHSGQGAVRPASGHFAGGGHGGQMPAPQGYTTGGAAGVSYDQANMPGYAWPSYAAYPNYSAVTYPKQYSPSAWPYIGPFYPYPQVPLGWRKVTLEWDDGWWFLDFSHKKGH